MSTAPLQHTVAAVNAADEWVEIRLGMPDPPTGWRRCADVDAAVLADWDGIVAAGQVKYYERSDPTAIAAFVLDYYAGIAGGIGGAFFRLARRVPRLGRADLAFRLEQTEGYPDGLALLDDRFWCLPEDPDAGHPAAEVVPDEAALGEVLRAQVRAHADDFLAGYRPAAKLPRRSLLGAFFDGLDVGIWYGADPSVAAAPEVLAAATAALPGNTKDFRDRSTVYRLTDTAGREHLSRVRIGCCYVYKLDEACVTCARTEPADRARRYAEHEGD